jgi:hydrogenase maturation factor HypF (carbamoyltransferase family)
MTKMYRILFTGRVHGVGFRFTVLHYAKIHNYVGTVQNIPEGVEIFINDKNFLRYFIPPSFARIDSETIEEADIVGKTYKDFRIVWG